MLVHEDNRCKRALNGTGCLQTAGCTADKMIASNHSLGHISIITVNLSLWLRLRDATASLYQVASSGRPGSQFVSLLLPHLIETLTLVLKYRTLNLP